MGERPAANIVLTGFSYTGKTKVGQEVARMLAWSFVDADEEIVRLSGKPVGEIFAQDGESRFRELEREVLERACRGNDTVISTGGGAIMDAANRELMLSSGVVVCLEAKPATIYQRLLRDAEADTGQVVRPLLAGPEPLRRIEWLKESRQAYYALADWTVHTDNLTIEEAAEEVVRGWRYGHRGRTAPPVLPTARESDVPYCEQHGAACVVSTATESYPIFVGWGHLDQLGRRMRNAGLTGRTHIVSDDEVFPIYGDKVKKILEDAGFAPESVAVAHGERSKSFETAVSLYDWLVEHRAERVDSVVALGGGVVGDLVGFVAATFLRGLPLVQVPTSLVGMVDSAIGGKVAIDHPEGKNLIGAFYQPRLVLADTQTLATLPRRELVSGWSEVVKHAMVRDPHLLGLLEERSGQLVELDEKLTTEVVAHSAAIKAEIVSEDEKERGVRVVLNYGHTIAHGLEAATDYQRFLHGEAVSIGMTGAAVISQRLGLLPGEMAERQEALLARFGLPTSCSNVRVESVLKAMELDKKVRGERVRWVLLADAGQPVIKDDVPNELVEGVIRKLLQS